MVDIFLIISGIGLMIGLGVMIWNSARKSAALELENKGIREELHTVVKGLRDEITRQTEERQSDILKTVIETKDSDNTIQKQTDSLKGDVKGIVARIQVLDTKIANSEDVHTEIKEVINRHRHEIEQDLKDQADFLTQWNQRIEDRIEELRKVVERRFNGCRDNEEGTKG